MSKSIDETVTKDLVETLEDGREGFAKGAEKLEESSHAAAATFRELSQQRAGFSKELQDLAAQYGDDIDDAGSVAATFHRGWMAIKDALSGSEPDGVLDAAEQGEDHAVSEYEKALGEAELSDRLRTVVQRQFVEVKTAHDRVRAMRDQA